MKVPTQLDWPFAQGICYSGYRRGQSPLTQNYPSRAEVAQDLHILARHWRYLRLYDCSRHADLVLQVIQQEKLDFKVMLGVDLEAEIQSPECPWIEAHSEQQLSINRSANDAQVARLIELANQYPEIIFAVSIGNEATVGWSDHRVSTQRLLAWTQHLRTSIRQPITFCENYVPWLEQIRVLGEALDFISLHSYPVWEYRSVDTALSYTQENFAAVAAQYPDKPIVITEAGWTTRSNGRGIEGWNANEDFQTQYYRELTDWVRREQILLFVFEAFDEPWKGSNHPDEPEKHWGLFSVERKPKKVMQSLYADLVASSEQDDLRRDDLSRDDLSNAFDSSPDEKSARVCSR